jgi:hypothetical protein
MYQFIYADNPPWNIRLFFDQTELYLDNDYHYKVHGGRLLRFPRSWMSRISSTEFKEGFCYPLVSHVFPLDPTESRWLSCWLGDPLSPYYIPSIVFFSRHHHESTFFPFMCSSEARACIQQQPHGVILRLSSTHPSHLTLSYSVMPECLVCCGWSDVVMVCTHNHTCCGVCGEQCSLCPYCRSPWLVSPMVNIQHCNVQLGMNASLSILSSGNNMGLNGTYSSIDELEIKVKDYWRGHERQIISQIT